MFVIAFGNGVLPLVFCPTWDSLPHSSQVAQAATGEASSRPVLAVWAAGLRVTFSPSVYVFVLVKLSTMTMFIIRTNKLPTFTKGEFSYTCQPLGLVSGITSGPCYPFTSCFLSLLPGRGRAEGQPGNGTEMDNDYTGRRPWDRKAGSQHE